ncbi:MAG: hypothetical protein V1729_02085 [Candidatus Woesearchaeota archaeon]
MMIARKMISRKKAYMRTLEAFFAFFLTFIFVVFIVLKGVSIKGGHEQLEILPALEQRDDFRDCVYESNITCLENLTRPFVPMTYNLKVSIDSPDPFKGAKDIYTETLFVSSNQTSDYKVVYLYYWLVSG